MLRTLKITMAVFGAVLAIEGILDIVLPGPRAAGIGLGDCASRAPLALAILGTTWLVAGLWIMIAARDPLRHLLWVKFALTLPLGLLLALAGTALRGHVAFRQIAVDIVFNAIFFVLFLVLYPRGARATGASPQA